MFHEKLRDLRKQHHMSQEELAHQLDVSRQSISKWESGISMPDLEKVIKLSDMFNVSLDELLKDRKSDSDFKFYTTDVVEKKAMSKINAIAMVVFTLSLATILTLLIISILEPHEYFNSDTGITYKGFRGYYYAYIDFRVTVIVSILAFLLSIITLILPDRILIDLFQKKI